MSAALLEHILRRYAQISVERREIAPGVDTYIVRHGTTVAYGTSVASAATALYSTLTKGGRT